jgi:hypothetical protein
MTTRVIRYRTRADAADENEKLVADVYAELAERRPPEMAYLTVRLPDGSFIHIHGDGTSALTGLDAFRRFQTGVADRCEEPPVAVEATIVGAYGFDR